MIMRYLSLFLFSAHCLLFWSCGAVKKSHELTLKNALDGVFFMGTALNTPQILGTDTASIRIIETHFNSITAENVMKSEVIHPMESEYNFDLSDKFVEFGKKNNMKIIGHTLIWHSQLSPWFCVDENGNDVSAEVLKKRMKSHIQTIVSRYRGRIQGWDVVNEAIEDDGSWRKSEFYEILGEDFMRLAFEYAHEADPEAELYYNDYSMANPRKRQGVVNMIKTLQEKGVKIDGVGMQAHLNMHYPSIEEFEKSILAFANLGVKVMITELDLSVLPSPRHDVGANLAESYEYQKEINPYTNGLPEEIQQEQFQRYMDFFNLFIKHKDKIDRVTLWGVSDGHSWKNNWPVRQRVDYPLLFDRSNNPKPIVEMIIREVTRK